MLSDQTDRNFSVVRATDDSRTESVGDGLRRKLEELASRLDKVNVFTKGQIVKWKPGLKNRRFPDYGEPAIVTAVLPDPIFDPSEDASASPYFQEPLTVVIGTCRDDDFIEFRLDGRRLEPFDS
jgi:hypothetical protein